MPDPATLRDSTQIVVAEDVLEGVREELERNFTVSIVHVDEDTLRIVGSPVEIKDASEFLGRRGVSIP
ncbi:VNG_1110C family protein [Halomicrococcus gelatinilyticus]|uniref:VNG_1110C family protein n=1 Tax=Halomicrococcus gelatinilyticus TaxID=1702103 RepID=UPI002E0E0AB5